MIKTIEREKIPYVPVQTGEVFLQDKIINDEQCHLCKKTFNKYEDKDMLLMRKGSHEMVFICPHHKGALQEFLKQFRTVPGGWEILKNEENDNNNANDNNAYYMHNS